MKRAVSVGVVGVVLVFAAAAYAATITCQGGRCEGTPDRDQITGTLEPDAIYGLGQEDRVEALGGHDEVWGGGSGDTLLGGPGSDDLHGGRGDELIRGKQGDDRIFGDRNPPFGFPNRPERSIEELHDLAPNDADAVFGGRGRESIRLDDGDGEDYAHCGRGGRGTATVDAGDEVDNCDQVFVP